jgi:F0F1-type ATP synthase alpha subunit
MRIVDSLLPIGRGQRQLILGDRYTGKTSIFISIMLSSTLINILNSIDGFGSKRIYGIYVGINVNLSKVSKLMNEILLIN